MYGPHLYNEYIKWLDAFINFVKKDMLDKNEKKYRTNVLLMSHLIKHGFMKDYRC
jgi:hypothetical protein